MSFLGCYEKTFSKKVWSSIKSYSDFIKMLVKKHASGGSYIYDDGDMRRGYFLYEEKMYMIRTWTINDKSVAYSIYEADITLEEALEIKSLPMV